MLLGALGCSHTEHRYQDDVINKWLKEKRTIEHQRSQDAERLKKRERRRMIEKKNLVWLNSNVFFLIFPLKNSNLCH